MNIMKKNIKAILLIMLGTISWSLVMVKSGWVYDFGMGFWGANGHDGIWHIALVESLSRGSLGSPVFSGESLQNYHIGFDLLVVLLHRITTIPVINLYFQIIPPVLSFLVGYLTYKFVLLWQKNKTKALWSTFFVYFGGSIGWLVGLVRNGSFGGESMFWSQQAVSTLVNPPFALSLVFILLGLISLLKLKKKFSLKYLALSALFFGLLIQIKVYAGLLVLGGLFVSGVWNILKKKNSGVLKVFASSLLFSLIIFAPFNKSAGSLVVFQPFWFLETMMTYTDRVGWERFYSAMTNYRLGGQWLKTIAAYGVAFVIFYYGNLGTRVIMEFGIARWITNKKLDEFKVLFISIILAGVAIPMFFLQKGTPWNTIQFFYYTLFFVSILAGVTLGEIKIKKSILGVIILLTIPTTLITLSRHYIPSRPPAKISNEELEALEFLSGEPSGVVLTFPFDRELAKLAESNPPRSLYLYESTSYVSAFSKKDVYLEDEVNLNITNYQWKKRREESLEFLETLNQNAARNFLKENNISYVYWVNDQRAKLGEGQLRMEKIFENGEVDIYKVK